MCASPATEIKEIHDLGVEVALVVGGGNLFRGHVESRRFGLDRSVADYMGMLATVMNGLAMQNALEQIGIPTRVMTAIQMHAVAEPYIRATVILPPDHVGAVMELCQERRGEHVDMNYLSTQRVQLRYDLPLAEIVLDFYDQLKSRSRGYASLDYELIGYRVSSLVKLDILLAGEPVDALSMVVHKDKAYDAGRALAERLQKKIPRQLYEVPIQASIGSRIIARETVKPMRKDVIAKCYGGDVTRKRKLLEKQKKGKKRMKQVGKIEVPQDAFLSVLELDGKK